MLDIWFFNWFWSLLKVVESWIGFCAAQELFEKGHFWHFWAWTKGVRSLPLPHLYPFDHPWEFWPQPPISVCGLPRSWWHCFLLSPPQWNNHSWMAQVSLRMERKSVCTCQDLLTATPPPISHIASWPSSTLIQEPHACALNISTWVPDSSYISTLLNNISPLTSVFLSVIITYSSASSSFPSFFGWKKVVCARCLKQINQQVYTPYSPSLRSNILWIAYERGPWVLEQSIDRSKKKEIDWFSTTSLRFGCNRSVINVSRGIDETLMGELWISWVITRVRG